ncbi:hypothetical protein [Gilvimarinus xylanilyticus]|uniref:Alginate export domain-containing protein n=1 Tax=Gilvimarinus xylanilyticus TaxID=2944139 RepID=A0A9X2HX64_9GAMM|nr:hypothetical protein [Gilvimarinus xylanilyticus]MCP8899299.1 hypothetical protein [Gilvimarinus xylanilyticus]
MRFSATFFLLATASSPVPADWSIDPSLIAFGDVYAIPEHHLEAADNDADLWLRRLYLTLDLTPAELPVSLRLRSETNGPDHIAEGDDFSNQLKDAYLAWDIHRHQVIFGKQSALTFQRIESFWQFRSLEKTAPDLQGITSRIFGLGVNGPLFSDKIRYAIATSTSATLGVDHAQQAKYQASLDVKLTERLSLELYADGLKSEHETPSANTEQVFIRWQDDKTRIGAHYTHRDSRGGNNTPGDVELFSVFASTSATPWPLIARVDRLLKPSARGENIDYMPFSPESKSTLYILGSEYRLSPEFRLLPNIEYVDYDGDITSDWYLKLTLEFSL